METLVLWIVYGVAGGMIYQSKNRPFVKGFLWGLLLGFIGVIVTLCKSRINITEEGREEKSNKNCRDCAKYHSEQCPNSFYCYDTVDKPFFIKKQEL